MHDACKVERPQLPANGTGLHQKAVPRFGEFYSCCCLPLLPQLACSIPATGERPYSRALCSFPRSQWHHLEWSKVSLQAAYHFYQSFFPGSWTQFRPMECNCTLSLQVGKSLHVRGVPPHKRKEESGRTFPVIISKGRFVILCSLQASTGLIYRICSSFFECRNRIIASLIFHLLQFLPWYVW